MTTTQERSANMKKKKKTMFLAQLQFERHLHTHIYFDKRQAYARMHTEQLISFEFDSKGEIFNDLKRISIWITTRNIRREKRLSK